MKRLDNLLVRLFDPVVMWLSRRVNDTWGCLFPVAVVVAGLYGPVVVRVLPLWYGVVLTVLVVPSALLGLAWLDMATRASSRSRLLDWTSSLRSLNGREFEELVAAVFEREGFAVSERGGYRRDGGVDFVASRDGRKLFVQCKCWARSAIPESVVNQLAAALTREKLPSSDGVIVALGDFLPEARALATQFGMSVVTGAELWERIEKVRRTEPCPLCGTPMVLARSVFGFWLRCTRCPGKRNLGGDADRVVALLLEQRARMARP